MSEETIVKTNQYLEQIATELDISETDYKRAEEHYNAIGDWLSGDDAALAVYEPSIYPQGSFRLGTVVKPLGRDEYDVDLVCHLDMSSSSVTPERLKALVGDRLKQHGTYLRMIEEKDRCWRLNYAGEFHMDILPAIPDPANGPNAILVSDKELANWRASDPKGYAEWFGKRMTTELRKLAEARGANVEQVPIYTVRTPLQRAIQLLKRHRDIRFNSGSMADDKPISMIITTLAARIYQSEADVYSALTNIVNTFAAHAPLLVQGGQIDQPVAQMRIIQKGHEGRWYIPNPVNPNENFADKWHEDGDRKAKAFFQWVKWLEADLGQILGSVRQNRAADTLKAAYGSATVDRALKALERAAQAGSRVSTAPHVIIENPGKPWTPHA